MVSLFFLSVINLLLPERMARARCERYSNMISVEACGYSFSSASAALDGRLRSAAAS